MSKSKITINVPSVAEMSDGIELAALHPPLREAQEAVTAAQKSLDEATRARADEQARVAGKQATGADVDELADALRRVQAASLVVEQCESELGTAREAVEAETAPARSRTGQELVARVERLQTAADELAPLLRALRDAWSALHAPANRLGFFVPPVAWPCSPDDRHRVPNWHRQ